MEETVFETPRIVLFETVDEKTVAEFVGSVDVHIATRSPNVDGNVSDESVGVDIFIFELISKTDTNFVKTCPKAFIWSILKICVAIIDLYRHVSIIISKIILPFFAHLRMWRSVFKSKACKA